MLGLSIQTIRFIAKYAEVLSGDHDHGMCLLVNGGFMTHEVSSEERKMIEKAAHFVQKSPTAKLL